MIIERCADHDLPCLQGRVQPLGSHQRGLGFGREALVWPGVIQLQGLLIGLVGEGIGVRNPYLLTQMIQRRAAINRLTRFIHQPFWGA